MLSGARVDTRRVAAVVAVLAISLALLGRSAFGAFEGASNVTHDTNAGTLTLTMTDGDAAQAILPVTVFAVYPGSSKQFLVDLEISDNLDFKTLNVSLAVCPSTCTPTVLDTDTVNGVQVAIDRCSQAWTHAGGTAPDRTYTCGGSTSVVQTTFPIVNTKSLTADPGDSLLEVGDVNHYRFTFSAPTTLPNSAQGAAVGIHAYFNGTQRDATNM